MTSQERSLPIIPITAKEPINLKLEIVVLIGSDQTFIDKVEN